MKNKIATLLLILSAILAVAGAFSSCATQRNAEKFYDKHPEELAKTCAIEYPVVSTVDSADYLKSQLELVKISEKAKLDNAKFKEDRNKLIEEIKFLKQKSPQDCKRLVHLTEQLLETESNRADSLEQVNKILSEKSRTAKPVIIKQRDTAAEDTLRVYLKNKINELEKCNIEGAKKDAKITELKGDLSEVTASRNKYRFYLWLLIAGIGIGIFFKVRSKIGF